MASTDEDRVLYRSDANHAMLIEYGASLRRARRRKSMTQAQLARRVGVVASDIRLLERGVYDGSLSLWADLVEALDITLGDLVLDSGGSD